MIKKKVQIYTDGACSGNPGRGSWAAILIFENNVTKEICGLSQDKITTNNKMELQAPIEALKLLKEPCDVEVFTDSKYVQLGMTEWIHGWLKKNWINSAKKPVENKELWIELLELSKPHNIVFTWIKGHANNKYNNLVDKLATNLLQS